MTQEMIDTLRQISAPYDVWTDELMQGHTTFRVGGPADVFVEIGSEEQFSKVLAYLKAQKQPYFVFGNGSNLLVSDKGVKGCMIHVGNQFQEIRVEGETIIARAGAKLSKVAAVAAEHALGGMEFAAGIPGTIGGAVYMNAGAYDGEMAQIVTSVRALNYSGEPVVFRGEEMNFGYRKSRLKKEALYAVEVTLRLHPADREEIKAKTDDLQKRRKEKQPLEYPSAGSTFKRPEGNFAGKLIQEAGLAGASIGGAEVSEKHCGFIINRKHASASDIRALITLVQEKVRANSGVMLEPEVIFLGEFPKA
ncbi:MAG: UDP-N-acetylmuramate dehydrogenase [Lachnospiraceae bacterium]|nr:UDP-N-acetylmuramate dehydrogenase [Lachnospiraceae bacterium]